MRALCAPVGDLPSSAGNAHNEVFRHLETTALGSVLEDAICFRSKENVSPHGSRSPCCIHNLRESGEAVTGNPISLTRASSHQHQVSLSLQRTRIEPLMLIINDRHTYAAACACGVVYCQQPFFKQKYSSKNTCLRRPQLSFLSITSPTHPFLIIFVFFILISSGFLVPETVTAVTHSNLWMGMVTDQGVPADVFIRVGAAAVLGTGACLLLRDSHAHLQWT